MKFSKIRYGAEIRLITGGQHAESHVFRQTLLNPARGKHSHANSHTLGSLPSCAGDTVVDLDLPLHTPTRSPKGPTGPPHPTHSKPDDFPATSHEGLAVTANLVQEGKSCKSWP